MAGVLGNYEWVAGMALDFGVPALGMAFGIPGPVSAFAVTALKKALGMKPNATEAEVQAKVEQMDPDAAKAAFQGAESEVTAKYKYLTELARFQSEVDKTNIAEVNKTIRAELGRVSWWHWRHLLGYIVGFHILAFPIATFGVILFASTEKTNAVLNFPILGILGVAAALLGVVMNDTTKKSVAAMTGEAPEGMVASTVRAVIGKKK